jgi:hypothetical protein
LIIKPAADMDVNFTQVRDIKEVFVIVFAEMHIAPYSNIHKCMNTKIVFSRELTLVMPTF